MGPTVVVVADRSLPDHHNRQMIRVSPINDKPGGSSPLLKLEQSLGTHKQLRHSHSDSTPSARPACIPLVPGSLHLVRSSVISALQELKVLPFDAKKDNQEDTAPATSHVEKVLQVFGGNPTLLLEE